MAKGKTTRLRPIGKLARVRSATFGKKMPADVRTSRSRVPDYQPADVDSTAIYPEARIDKPCTRKGGIKRLRPCHVEVTMVGAKLAAANNVLPGPYLRLCRRFGERGVLVSVTGQADATAKAEAFCACREKGSTAAACATKMTRGKK